jgi:DNA-binding transcriptional MerR regulator
MGAIRKIEAATQVNVTSDKSPGAYRTISEVADGLDLPQHVLRFWETRFPQIRPLKRGGGRRYYRPEDVELLSSIRRMLYDQGYTIKGVQKLLREQGAAAVIAAEARAAGPESQMVEPRVSTPRMAERADPIFEAPVDSAGGGGFDATDIGALRAALADIREAERQLRQARGE